MSPSVHIIVVNWNTGHYLRDCLRSMVAAYRDSTAIARVTVVDNNSCDGSADGLYDLPLPLEVIRNRHNAGFAAACNQGAAGSRADYLLFLNPDTRLFPDTITLAIGYMESERARSVGICGVRVVDEAGCPTISCARFPSLRIMLGKMTGLDRVSPRLFPSHHLTAAELSHSRCVDQVIGAFYLVRRDLFERLSGFDTRYFLYYEEVDFALRARRQAAHSYFLHDAAVLHAENVSASRLPVARLYHSLYSRLLFAFAHWPRWQARVLVLSTLSVELAARLGRAGLNRNWGQVSETLVAYRRLAGQLLRRHVNCATRAPEGLGPCP